MKRNKIAVILAVLLSITTYGQEVTGKWFGVLKVQSVQLRLVFNIDKTQNGYTATMDSPDQGAKGIPVTSTSFENSILKLEITPAKIQYEGTLQKDNTIVGIFKQRGQSFEMNLSREAEKINRPQEPVKPYGYYEEEVTFENKKEKITLAGTLTLPKKEGNFPAVILISGSGPQNRDEEVLGHKPFLVLSDYLTRNGIAVLRYDDRGTAQSKGDFKTATSLDFASDVEAALQYLKTRKEIIKNNIGLVGHSEGGMIAPMVASKANNKVGFIVLLAGLGIPGDQLLLLQQEQIGKINHVSDNDLQKSKKINTKIFELISKSNNATTLKTDLINYIKQTLKENPSVTAIAEENQEQYINQEVAKLTNPWIQYFIKYNPEVFLSKVKCPVLALNGDKDLQVASKENLAGIKKALEKAENKKTEIQEMLGLNHFFQECQTGSPSEYATIEQTISPPVLEKITKWIISSSK
jgi:uncharacterized protein